MLECATLAQCFVCCCVYSTTIVLYSNSNAQTHRIHYLLYPIVVKACIKYVIFIYKTALNTLNCGKTDNSYFFGLLLLSPCKHTHTCRDSLLHLFVVPKMAAFKRCVPMCKCLRRTQYVRRRWGLTKSTRALFWLRADVHWEKVLTIQDIK